MLKIIRAWKTLCLPLVLWLCYSTTLLQAQTEPFNDIFSRKSTYLLAEEHDPLLLKLYHVLDSIVMAHPDYNEMVVQRFKVIRPYIDSKDLLLITSADRDSGILGGASLVIPADTSYNSGFIEFHERFMRIAETQPSIVLSILMHEIQHAYDYFISNNFRNNIDNQLERYLYDMDALFLEAVFIRDYIVPFGYNLTTFEDFLIGSLEYDNLHSVSVMALQINMSLVYYLHGFIQDSRSYEANLSEILDIGKKIIGSFQPSVSPVIERQDWENYLQIVQLWTFTQMVPQITYNIVANKAPETVIRDSNIPDRQALNDLLNHMHRIMDEHQDYFSYRDTLMAQFDIKSWRVN